MKMIRDLVNKALTELKLETVDFGVSHPKEESHGDYSANVAMILAKKLGKNPRELAQEIVSKILDSRLQTPVIEKVEVAGPPAGGGFINFYLKKEFFLEETKKAIESGYGKNEDLKGKNVMVEYTDPNPFKEMHIGHLMSNTIGESLARILEANGAEVRRANYQGDVGLHVAKSVWGIINNSQIINSQIFKSSTQISNWIAEWGKKSLIERQKFMGQAYAYGATKYEEDERVKAEINALNKVIYEASDAKIDELYQAGRKWSLEYFEMIYQRLGTKFDEYFFESEAGQVGLLVVEEGLKKKVLEVGEEGAVVFKGEKYGLHTRVFRNKLGLPTYEAKDLGLAKTKWERYKYDLSYIVTANEIDEYFKVLLKTLSLLYPDLAARTRHLSHGMMKLTSGKMSSRTGVVVTGEGLLNDLQEAVLKKMGERDIKDREKVADQIAIGSLKYTVLKQAVGGDIVYEPEKMTNLEGNTGPYIQYTYVRAFSVLNKFQIPIDKLQTILNLKFDVLDLQTEEISLLRWLYRYPEVVEEAGEHFAPHLVSTYIYDLAQRFNTFYQECRVFEEDPTSSRQGGASLGAGGEVNELRYALTQATANVLKSGLELLGIQAPAEM